MKVELNINNVAHVVEVEPRTSLLDCLRDKLLLTGAHAGCEHGVEPPVARGQETGTFALVSDVPGGLCDLVLEPGELALPRRDPFVGAGQKARNAPHPRMDRFAAIASAIGALGPCPERRPAARAQDDERR